MNKSIKLFSLLFVLISIFGCDISDEDIKTPGETVAKYTFVRDAVAGKITFLNTSENADSFIWDFGDQTSSALKNPVKTFSETGDYEVTLSVINSKTGATSTFKSTISVFIFQGGLITNGDFESGINSWLFGVTNPMPTGWLVTQNGNTYASVNIAMAGQPFDVNISQKGLNMTAGTTYRLTFDAWSNVNRTLVVGIGLSGGAFTNQSVTRNLTPAVQSFSIDLVANFTSANSRVLFDMGGAVGRVNIDNVTLNAL